MAVNSVGGGANVQQALGALRQTVQAEQLAAAAVTEAARNVAQTANQTANQTAAVASSSSGEGPGENETAERGVDFEA